MRFEPIPDRIVPLGRGPFLVRGVVYLAVLRYVQKKLPGGMLALEQALSHAPTVAFLDQIFVAASSYDISPLVRVCAVAAGLEGRAPSEFTRDRARESANMDVKGIYKFLLKLTSPEAMGERLPRAFNRYFEPCRAGRARVRRGTLDSELSKIPECMSGWYMAATDGFVSRALEMARAQHPRFSWSRPEADGEHERVAIVRLPFKVRWG